MPSSSDCCSSSSPSLIHKHHIIPKSRGGTDDPWNFIDLEERDHAIKHAIDFVLFESAPWVHGATIKLLPDDLALAVKAEMSRRMVIRNTGHKHSEATKKKIGKKSAEKTHSEETKRKISEGVKANPNVKPPPEAWSPEANEKRRKAMTGKKKTAEMKENSRQAALKRWEKRREK